MSKTHNVAIGDIIRIPGKDGRWVVERAEMEGGGIGHHPGDRYPDANHVTARLLESDLAYKSDNPALVFYQGGDFDPATTLVIPNVKVVGRMTRTFIDPDVDEEDTPAPPEPTAEATAAQPVEEAPEAAEEPEPAPADPTPAEEPEEPVEASEEPAAAAPVEESEPIVMSKADISVEDDEASDDSAEDKE